MRTKSELQKEINRKNRIIRKRDEKIKSLSIKVSELFDDLGECDRYISQLKSHIRSFILTAKDLGLGD